MKMLIIDDDYIWMEMLADILIENSNCTVGMGAQKDILNRLKQERFDLLIIDGMIPPFSRDKENNEVQNIMFDGVPPAVTGLELIKRIRDGQFLSPNGTPKNVPIIHISANPVFSEYLPNFQSENLLIFDKLMDFEEFFEAIDALLNKT